MRGGTFITVEGGDGSGKTTLIHSLALKLQQTGHEVLITREPGGSPIAEAIRAVILSKENTAMDARTEALLYAAARRQHLAEKVFPALQRGVDVLCDRFVDSSLVYQGYGRGLGLDAVWDINRFATEGCMPDLTIYLDLDPEIGLKRIQNNRDREMDRLDLESLAFHRRVREAYLLVAEQFKERIVTIDASVSKEEIAAQAWTLVEGKLKL
ncbi:thymidylate kinase [Cohnella kolymensis]|uniref:Thymidylate kinase n=1 Tax=Cohnella kolymensis TaxID=1590652 RepID=A0ABR5A1J5_9BACL|nr:dTMP kinase [Cohnella kolymensis]KIL34934.1 thymidylate kinase [Cohnella kolymensis]